LGTGLGSYYFKRSKVGTPIAFLAANISFVASIFLVKIVFGYLQYRANPDIFSLFMLSAVFILPVSFCVGYCFSSFYSDMTKLWRLYAVESVAAFLGGLIFTFGIVGNLDPITVSLIFLSIALLLVRATRYVKLLYVDTDTDYQGLGCFYPMEEERKPDIDTRITLRKYHTGRE
jgi:hypothetical protein